MKEIISWIRSCFTSEEKEQEDPVEKWYTIFNDYKTIIIRIKTRGDELKFVATSGKEYERAVRNIQNLELDEPIEYISVKTGCGIVLWKDVCLDEIPGHKDLRTPEPDYAERVTVALKGMLKDIKLEEYYVSVSCFYSGKKYDKRFKDSSGQWFSTLDLIDHLEKGLKNEDSK